MRYALQVTRIDTPTHDDVDMASHLRRHVLFAVRTANGHPLEAQRQHRLRLDDRRRRASKSILHRHLLSLTCFALKLAKRRTQSSRQEFSEVDESSRALYTKHRAHKWHEPRTYIGLVNTRPEQLVTRDPNK